VLTGGGARAAYQVGLLRCLARRRPELRFPIITGVSAGAINAAFLAAHPDGVAEAAHELSRLWGALEFDHIFRVDPGWLFRNFVRWSLRMLSGGARMSPEVRGLMSTQPLRSLLERELADDAGEIQGIARNIEAGQLRAVALLTVNYATGRTETWVEGANVADWERPGRRSRRCRMTIDHVMASASLPLLFPAVELDGAWYGDGGIRMAEPLAPALHLAADRILAVSTRYVGDPQPAPPPARTGYPVPALIAGNLMNAVFLDALDRDVRVLERVNRLVEKLEPGEREDLRHIDIVVLRPSQDLGRLAADYERTLPKAFRHLTRGLGTRQTSSPDFLSLLMFHPGYLSRLMEIGERDAAARWSEIDRLLG